MKQCPNGHNVGDNVKFCPECGAEITDNGAKFCAKCGNERKGTEKFCSQCGTPFGQSLIVNDKEIKGQGKSAKKGVVIASIVAIIVLLGGAAWYFLGNQQDKYSLEGLAKVVVNYDMVSDFHEGFAMVTKGDKYGFIDKMGNEVIPCIYEFMEEADPNFHDGLALVHQGEKHFFINKEGKEAFPYNYDTGLNFSDGLALVWKDRKCGYIDANGKVVIPLTDKYYGDSFHDGLAAVRNNDGKYGFINKKGELVIPISFDFDEGGETTEFHEGLAPICKNEKYGYVDKSGKELSIDDYSFVLNFSDGMAVVMKNNKYGFIDPRGKEVIPCKYDEANSFSEGFAVVSKDGKYLVIDKKGNEVLTPNYDRVSDFHDGLACVYRNNGSGILSGYIDTNGKEVIPCIYNSFSNFSEGLAVVEKDGVYGFVDKKGNSTFDLQDEGVKSVIQAKIDEKEKARIEEERRAEEERKEQERRRGVDKEVTLSCTKGNGHSIMPQDRLSGNYGAYGTSNYVRSNTITVPNNKVWVFDKYEIIEGQPLDIALFYFSRLSQRNESDAKYELDKGNIPIFRGGDKIMISFMTTYPAETYRIRVLFKEKDEDLYF